uniref:Uncharacterized protein n=1 Tax=Setaria viridis TaxID=4556 RepID=A0A4U6WAB0_SETVI|nr:hypothetical protein SEVIR_1G193800v2 [Setaria viridis]
MPRASATRLRRSTAVTASSTARHAQQQAAPSLLKDCSADAVGTTSWGQQAALEFSAYESRSSSSSIARPLEPCSRTSTRQHHPDRSEALRPCLLQLTPPQGSAPSPTYKESRFSAGAQRGKEKGRRWTCTASASARWYFSETVFSFAVLHSFVIYVDRFFLPYRFHS